MLQTLFEVLKILVVLLTQSNCRTQAVSLVISVIPWCFLYKPLKMWILDNSWMQFYFD